MYNDISYSIFSFIFSCFIYRISRNLGQYGLLGEGGRF